MRICTRASRLGVPEHEPIAVFTKGREFLFITDKLVAELLRTTDMTVLKIGPNDPQLSLWSTHSVRVTAANLLHRAKFADTFIQKRLRWRSKSFLDYLRNTVYAADQHSKGMDISDNNLPPLAKQVYREDEPHELILAPAA